MAGSDLYFGAFDDWFGQTLREMSQLANNTQSAYNSNFPPSDVFIDERTGELWFELAVAGYDPKDINIYFSGETMKIKSNRTASDDKLSKMKVIKHGIKASNFECTYQLAAGKFDTEKATAQFKNGILQIHIPAAKDKQPRQVEINVL